MLFAIKVLQGHEFLSSYALDLSDDEKATMLIAELKTQLQDAKYELNAARTKDGGKQGADDSTINSTTEVETAVSKEELAAAKDELVLLKAEQEALVAAINSTVAATNETTQVSSKNHQDEAKRRLPLKPPFKILSIGQPRTGRTLQMQSLNAIDASSHPRSNITIQKRLISKRERFHALVASYIKNLFFTKHTA